MLPLFLYGTLLDPRVLARQSGDPRLARRLLPAKARGFRRVFLRGTPYPTLLAGKRKAAVKGALLRPTPAALARLKAYEGPGYRLTPLTVTTKHGPRRARAWIAAPWRADPARDW
ncbi:gamma-glutamylcyclotransferase [Acetobacteraceae bacterium H6797]|nr:gamma-glutamylcyclotransferase [Acetobacteraceae bacterium H6797]